MHGMLQVRVKEMDTCSSDGVGLTLRQAVLCGPRIKGMGKILQNSRNYYCVVGWVQGLGTTQYQSLEALLAASRNQVKIVCCHFLTVEKRLMFTYLRVNTS